MKEFLKFTLTPALSLRERGQEMIRIAT